MSSGSVGSDFMYLFVLGLSPLFLHLCLREFSFTRRLSFWKGCLPLSAFVNHPL
ncbi:unnamed protein product [Arabidopsis halleri]